MSLENRIRKLIGRALIPVFTFLRRRESTEVETQLVRFRHLRAEWHRLSQADYHNGIDVDDKTSAGHRAYLAYNEECTRLRGIALPPHLARWYGWRGSGMTTGCENYGDLASLSGFLRSEDLDAPLIPLRRREWFAVIGWGYSPPPTNAELAGWRRVFEAMSRVDVDHYATVGNVGPFENVHMVSLDSEYFQELAANLHEIDAETDAKNPEQHEAH